MFKLLKRLLSLGFVFSTVLFGYMLYKADYGLQDVNPKEITNKEPRLPVYLVSYADGNDVFYKNQNALTASAQNKGFDFYFNYRKELLDVDFREKYKDVLEVKSGAGLWLWKPQIMLQTMKAAPKDAIIIYTDVGFVYVRPIDEYFEMLGDNDVMLMNIDDYATKEKLIEWLPKKISQEWGIDKLQPEKMPKFIASGWIVVRNNERAKKLMQQWLEICARPEYAFMQYDPKEDGIKGFTYDQSLLSLIAYKYPEGVKIVPIEQFKRMTIYHHRHPGNNKPLLPLQVLPAKQLREWIGEKFPEFFLIFGY